MERVIQCFKQEFDTTMDADLIPVGCLASHNRIVEIWSAFAYKGRTVRKVMGRVEKTYLPSDDRRATLVQSLNSLFRAPFIGRVEERVQGLD